MGKGSFAKSVVDIIKNAWKMSHGDVEKVAQKIDVIAPGVFREGSETATKSFIERKGMTEMFDKELERLSKEMLISQQFETMVEKKVVDDIGVFYNKVQEQLSSGSMENAKKLLKDVIQDDKLVENAFATGDFRSLKPITKQKYYDDTISKEISSKEEQLRTWLGNEKVDGMIADAKTPTELAEKFSISEAIMHDADIKAGNFKQNSVFDQAMNLASDLNSTLGQTYETLISRGRTMPAKILENMHHLNSTADTTKAKLEDIFDNAALALDSMSPAKQNNLRRYIDTFSLEPNRYVPGGMQGDRAINGDWDLVKQLNSTVGASDMMLLDDVRLANKIINAMRYTKRMELNRKQNKIYDVNDLPTWNQIADHDIEIKHLLGPGDYGPNFFHIQGNKEYFEKLKKMDPDLLARMGITTESEYAKSFDFRKMRRAEGSALRMSDADRMAPGEELRHYARTYSGAMIAGEYKAGLNELHRALLLDKYVHGNPYADIIKPVETAINAKLTGARFKNWEDMGTLEKTVHSFINLEVTTALMSPRMWFFNAPQGILTGGAGKGFANSLQSFVSQAFETGKTIITNPKKMYKTIKDPKQFNEIFHEIANNKSDPFTQSLFQRMVNEHSEFYRVNLPLDNSKTFNTLRKFSDVAMLGFNASDKVARFSIFDASIKKGRKEYAKFMKNVNSGMNKREAMAQLHKDMHMGEFDYLTQKKILDSINFADMNNNKEFMYQYGSASVKAEGFDYGKSGSPFLKDWANSKHPLLGAAFTFTSWNMYYLQLLKGAFRSYQNGDPRLLGATIGAGFAWLAGASLAASSDNELVSDYGRYATNRTPFFMPIMGLLDMPARDIAGITKPIVRGTQFPLVAGLKYFQEYALPRAKKANSIDFMYEEILRDLKHTIPFVRIKGAYENMEGLYSEIKDNGLNIF